MFEEGRGQYYSVPPGVASLGILALLLGILGVVRKIAFTARRAETTSEYSLKFERFLDREKRWQDEINLFHDRLGQGH